MTYVSYTSGPQPTIAIEIPRDLLSLHGFDERMEEAIYNIALEARSFWETLAGQRLNTSRDRYIAAIGMKQVSEDEVHLVLTDPFAINVEKGWTMHDQKPGFLNSSKIQTAPKKRRIPRAVAATLQPNPNPAKKWMIIPLNTNRQAPMGYPGAFRTFTDKQTNLWPKNYRTFKGVFLGESVVDEIRENIMPREIEAALDELMGA